MPRQLGDRVIIRPFSEAESVSPMACTMAFLTECRHPAGLVSAILEGAGKEERPNPSDIFATLLWGHRESYAVISGTIEALVRNNACITHMQQIEKGMSLGRVTIGSRPSMGGLVSMGMKQKFIFWSEGAYGDEADGMFFRPLTPQVAEYFQENPRNR